MKKQKISCENARKISLMGLLQKFGHFPKKRTEKEAWFLSPLRLETLASFKVNLAINRWYDHGLGKGGNVIDLIMLLNKCSVSEALGFLNNESSDFSFHQLQSVQKKVSQEKNYKIIKVKLLEHRALLDYLKSRKINMEIAKKYCVEIHYELNDKKYFAIGFENDLKGYEIRNKYVKGNLKNKNVTTIKNGSNFVCLFEGFIDFLSFKTYYKNRKVSADYIILNSTSKARDIILTINNYKKTISYLDNDSAGKRAVNLIKESCKNEFIDGSTLYKSYDDFNAFLIDIVI